MFLFPSKFGPIWQKYVQKYFNRIKFGRNGVISHKTVFDIRFNPSTISSYFNKWKRGKSSLEISALVFNTKERFGVPELKLNLIF